MSNGNGKKVEIINSIKGPIGLLTLVILVSEVILGLLAAKAEGTDFTLLVAGMLEVLITVLIIIYKKHLF